MAAKELIFTGRILTSIEALKYGIVSYAEQNAYDKALALAREILPNGPIALRMVRLPSSAA